MTESFDLHARAAIQRKLVTDCVTKRQAMCVTKVLVERGDRKMLREVAGRRSASESRRFLLLRCEPGAPLRDHSSTRPTFSSSDDHNDNNDSMTKIMTIIDNDNNDNDSNDNDSSDDDSNDNDNGNENDNIDNDYDSDNVNIDNEPRSFMSILSYPITESYCLAQR